MNEQVAIQFKQEFPVISFPETMLLPHAVMPITVTEPHDFQMVNQVLDSNGQIAIASAVDTSSSGDSAILRTTVCLGQVVQHEKLLNGYNLMVYGLCRAEIMHDSPASKDNAFRTVKLRPVEDHEQEDHELEIYRVELLHFMFRPNMERLEQYETIMDWIVESRITISALFEVVACTLFQDFDFRYKLLCESSKETRCILVLKELEKLDIAISMANKQSQDRWKNGTSLN
jgi:Lon protease-like protein